MAGRQLLAVLPFPFSKDSVRDIVSEILDSSDSADSSDEEELSPAGRIQHLDEVAFKHVPLPDAQERGPSVSGEKYIRLLHLLPGHRKQDLACELRVVRLDQAAGQYEALSYVWGEDPTARTVWVDSKDMKIGSGLRLALLNLRHESSTRVLWTDAICINQEDMAEKVKQVAIMGDIYRNAAQTIIWLGEGDGQSPGATQRAMDYARALAAEAKASQHSLERADQVPDKRKGSALKRANKDTELIEVLGHSWWGRVWTTQEILLAKRATIVQGRYQIDWDTFCSGIRYGIDVGIWSEASVILGAMDGDSMIRPLTDLESLRHPPVFENPADKLLFYLSRTRTRASTLPKDKIFSLLGLLPPDDIRRLGILPDYTSSVAQVYVGAAKQILKVSRNLDALGACCPRWDEIRDMPQLPSWTPHWGFGMSDDGENISVLPMLMEDARGRRRTTHASCGTAASVGWEDNDETLVLEGHVVDIITKTTSDPKDVDFDIDDESDSDSDVSVNMGKTMAKLYRFSTKIHRATKVTRKAVRAVATTCVGPYFQWEAFVQKLQPTNSDSGSVGVGEAVRADPMLVYCLTLCTGTLAPGGVVKTRELFEDWRWRLGADIKKIGGANGAVEWGIRDGLQFLGSNWSDYSPFYEYMTQTTGRRLGATKEGALCLVPNSAKAGDHLMLMKGGRVPLVFRPVEGGYLNLVGEAYIQGIMNGEAFDEAKCTRYKIR